MQILVWLNALANAVGRIVFAPIAAMPGWLSAAIIGAVTGVIMLYAYKYTSNQAAIERVRSDIKASLLALKLFKDDIRVVLNAQGRIVRGAFMLIVLSLVPMLVMIVPVLLVMTQMSLWYQQGPLPVEKTTEVVLTLGGSPEDPFPEIELAPPDAVEVDTIVEAPADRKVLWEIHAKQSDYYKLAFLVDGQPFEKELAVGDGMMRVSKLRPALDFEDVLLYPAEAPFGPDSAVQSIEINYPDRDSWTSGSDRWVIYWFAVSMVVAFALHKPLNVKI